MGSYEWVAEKLERVLNDNIQIFFADSWEAAIAYKCTNLDDEHLEKVKQVEGAFYWDPSLFAAFGVCKGISGNIITFKSKYVIVL